MPLLIQCPELIAPATTSDEIVVNVDFGPTLLDLMGVPIPDDVQGQSFATVLMTAPHTDPQKLGSQQHSSQHKAVEESVRPQSMYYRYWMHRDGAHLCPAHYGIRTKTHKLICYYNDPLDQPGAHGPSDPVEWELFDLVADPFEVSNLYGDPQQADLIAELETELLAHQERIGDTPYPQRVGPE